MPGQSNAQPAGGNVALQPVAPVSVDPNISALVDALQPIQIRFRQQSSPLSVELDSDNFTANKLSASAKITNVGLGFRTITHWHMVFNLTNTNAAAQSVSLSPLFPYNLISRVQTQINGGAMVYNASGPGGLVAWLRKLRPSMRYDNVGGYGQAFPQALVQVTVGANGTVTNAIGKTVSGIASISVAGTTTSVLTVDFWTIEKYTLDRNSLLGALPLQNSATNATITYTLVPQFVGGAAASYLPFYNAGANTSVAIQSTSFAQSLYEFWSVPSDSGLYLPMISSSYQIQEDSGNTVASVAADALKYNIPRNMYLVAAHMLAYDTNGTLLPASAPDTTTNCIDPLRLQYNAGTIRVIQMGYSNWRARQYADYASDVRSLPGYYLWDGDATSESLSETDNAGWLDAYNAANPQIVGTLRSGVAVPLTFSLIREQVVDGNVQVV